MKFGFIEQHAHTGPVRLMYRGSASHPAAIALGAPGPWVPEALPTGTHARQCSASMPSTMAVMAASACMPRSKAKVRRGRVERLMHRHGIRALAHRFPSTTADSRHTLPVAPDLLEQKFIVSAPNRVWLANIAYIPTGERWLYLAAVLDLAPRKVVGLLMCNHMRTELTLGALIMAAQRND
jgi:putative transposase